MFRSVESRFPMVMALVLFLLFAPAVASALTVVNDYFAVETIETGKGPVLEKSIIAGPPTPPFPEQIEPVEAPEYGRTRARKILSGVPAFSWSYGCSATSAAMIAGYYDRSGFPDMYTGPTNGGVMPLNNDEHWSTVEDDCGETRNRCPLSATMNGLDGRTSRGHVDDYWICYDNPGPDPFVTNGWSEHTAGDCTGDFMGTNQSTAPLENADGATSFFTMNDGSKITAEMIYAYGPDAYDQSGMYGVKEFYESRGYTVLEAYNQLIHGFNGNTQGFTYEQYKNEIDNNRPVMFHVQGHTMVGIGYDDSSSNLMYIHNTWDHSVHTMEWGGSYQDMQHYAVTIVVLDGAPAPQGQALPPAVGTLLLDN